MKNKKILDEFETLDDNDKKDVFEFMLFLIFKRKFKIIKDEYGFSNYYIPLKDIIN